MFYLFKKFRLQKVQEDNHLYKTSYDNDNNNSSIQGSQNSIISDKSFLAFDTLE